MPELRYDAGMKARRHTLSIGIAALFAFASMQESRGQVVPATPNKFATRTITGGGTGSASIGIAQPKPQPTTVRTTAHIALGEARQWKSTDGKSLLGKLIAFEDLVVETKQEPGTKPVPATLPPPPEKPTVIRDGKARLLVDNKAYEVPLDRLGEDERKFIQQIKDAIDAKKAK
jgi:hypothetical protein